MAHPLKFELICAESATYLLPKSLPPLLARVQLQRIRGLH
jgi:hypothetical protein